MRVSHLVDDAELLEEDLAEICPLFEFRNATTSERERRKALGRVKQSIDDADGSCRTLGRDSLYDFYNPINRWR